MEPGIVGESERFATAKLKTYPPRLNAANVLAFVNRFATACGHLDNEERGTFLESAFNSLLERCIEIEGKMNEGPFADQGQAPCSIEGHQLFELALWPDRQA